MNRFPFLIAVTLLGISQVTLCQDVVIPPEELVSDLKLIRSALEEAHPGLYRYTPKKRLDSLFVACESALETALTQRAFYGRLLPLIDEIHCGHTKLMPSTSHGYPYYYYTDQLFPLKLYIQDDRAFVIGSFTDAGGIEKGDEVIAIQGHPMDEIIHYLLDRIFSDGTNKTFKYYELNRYFAAYYADLIETGTVVDHGFSVRIDRNGQETEFEIPPATLHQLQAADHSREDSRKFSLSFPAPETAMLSIPFFWNPREGPTYKGFLNESFRVIEKMKCKHLIIDLRDNEGGKEVYGSLLLSYLAQDEFRYYDRLEITRKKGYSFSQYASVPLAFKLLRRLFTKTEAGPCRWEGHKNCRVQKPRKNAFHGEVYVLINGGCFSVTTEFASVLQSLQRAVFIGEETGGGYRGNNSGFFAIVKLPYSELELGIPLMGFYSCVKDIPFHSGGIEADFRVMPTVQGIMEEKDEVLEYTLGLIHP